MLVLTRRVGQAIRVGDDIEITVVEVRGDQVRLGISAPRNVSIVRREILDEILEETREAATADPAALSELADFTTPEG